MNKKYIIIACESSGTLRDLFAEMCPSYEVWSIDLLPTDILPVLPNAHHHIGDVREFIDSITRIDNTVTSGRLTLQGNTIDLIVAHPPCTYLASSGLFRNTSEKFPIEQRLARQQKTEEALEFVQYFIDLYKQGVCKSLLIENPVGCISTRLPDAKQANKQIVQPYEYGDDASKKTCLWMWNFPPLVPTIRIRGRIVDMKERFSNQTDSGQNRLPPSADRWKLRSKTYVGIAIAIVESFIK